jgi:chromosome segregation ATPase
MSTDAMPEIHEALRRELERRERVRRRSLVILSLLLILPVIAAAAVLLGVGTSQPDVARATARREVESLRPELLDAGRRASEADAAAEKARAIAAAAAVAVKSTANHVQEVRKEAAAQVRSEVANAIALNAQRSMELAQQTAAIKAQVDAVTANERKVDGAIADLFQRTDRIDDVAAIARANAAGSERMRSEFNDRMGSLSNSQSELANRYDALSVRLAQIEARLSALEGKVSMMQKPSWWRRCLHAVFGR